MDTPLEPHRVVAHEPGTSAVLTVEPFTPQEPMSGYLLVEVAAAGVNFIDTYQRSGIYPMQFPLTLGSEGSGTIVATAQDETRFRNGDRVMWNAAPGSYATHALVPTHNAFPVPPEIDLVHAAAIPLQGLTAHYLATDSFKLEPGHVALIHAGAGGIGVALTQMAKALGAHVITTVSTAEKEEISRLAGADDVIRYDKLHDLAAELPPIVAKKARTLRDKQDTATSTKALGDGVDVVYDGIGAATFSSSLKSLRTRGTLVLFGGSSGQVPPIDLQTLNTSGSLTVTRPSLGHFILDRAELEQRYHQVLTWKQEGKLSIRIGQTFSLANAAQAHDALESRITTGKTLLIP